MLPPLYPTFITSNYVYGNIESGNNDGDLIMSYDAWLQRPYMIDTPHYKVCPLHEDRDFDDNDECMCVELDIDAKANAEEMAFELSRE